jgi:hypothetical protein
VFWFYALTRHFANHSISPESSDGFASVGTILPKEEAALLPGGLFAFYGATSSVFYDTDMRHVTNGCVACR